MADGAFSDKARAAIYECGGQRCLGCGRTDLTAQHRDARGMGGTSRGQIGSPANGIPACGSGTTGCHGWIESNPEWAELLGWRITSGSDPEAAPFWSRFGWRRWRIEDDGFPSVVYVDTDDLDRRADRDRAVDEFTRVLALRNAKATSKR